MVFISESEYEPIFVTSNKGEKVRILGPWDYDRLRATVPKEYLGSILDVCLWTGARYVEVQRLYDNPEWFQKTRKNIFLGREATKKARRVAPERYISPLPPQLVSILPYFFKDKKPPARDGWNNNIKRWAEKAGFDPLGFSAKTTRKTIESWMLAAGVSEMQICLRQGHTQATSLQHYSSIGFTREEKEEIRRRLKGWMIE